MASQPIPTVPYLRSKYRLCSGSMRLYRTELLLLENELETGEITQKMYDETVAAINRDLDHLAMLRQELTEIRYQEPKEDAA